MVDDESRELLFRSGDPNYMTSLARGLAVVSAFSGNAHGMRMAEISRITGLSRAVVRRCLYTLQQLGYARAERELFYLEPKVLSLTHSYLTSTPLPVTAQPFLNRVSDQTDESCSLAVMDGDDVVYIARSATKRIMTVALSVGSRLPAYCTSLGRVLLATKEPAEVEAYLGRTELEKHTEHTDTSAESILQTLAQVRERGFATVNQELEIGLRSLAVPVHGPSGVTVAAMNVGVQATRISQEDLESKILPVLAAAAKELSSHLPG